MARVLVTGATGYLGGVLVPLLRDSGHEVIERGSRGEWYSGESVDAVIHLAWYSSAGNGQEIVQQQCADRTAGLITELKEMPKTPRFIFASTASVYGDRGKVEVTEETMPNPNCAYTHAKMQTERQVGGMLGSCIFRFGSMMGRGLTRTKCDLIVNAYCTSREFIDVWNPQSWKPILHVRDAARLLAAAVEVPALTGTFNAAAVSLPALEIAKRVAAITRAEICIVKDQTGPRSCRLSCRKLRGVLPYFGFLTLGDTVREMQGYTPTPADRNTPWK